MRFLLPLVIMACGGEGLLLPSAGEPSRISVISGDGQTGTVGQPLADSLVVKVTDPEDRPVSGVEVEFVAPAGAVLAPDDTVVTGADGQASVLYTLSTTAGDQMIQARAKPVVPSPSLNTAFHQTALPDAATALVVLDGNEQTGEAGAPLPDSLAVRAVDRYGNGVSGIEVSWEASGGQVSPATAVTGADGRATTERTLGTRPGPYETTASAGELEGSPVAFTATGIAPPSPQIVVVTQPSATAAAGVPFTRQPVIQLQDASGAPLARADVAVTVQIASGGGSLGGGTTVRSNAEGVVRFTNLSIGGSPGDRTLIFAASDFTSALSRDIDLGAGPPLLSASSASVPASGTPGVATTITVQLRDAFGTPVEGAGGDIAISIAGANPVAGLPVTGGEDGSYSAVYTPIASGTDQVDVRLNGQVVPGSPFLSVVAPGPASAATTTASVVKGGFFFYTIDILVTTRDAQGNLLNRGGDLVQVHLDGGIRNAVDHGNGNYSDSFVILNPSPEITITLNGVPISGSPFRP